MRIIVFSMEGNVISKFNCSRHLEFPNGVCTNDQDEIFVSDNRAHSVKVFNYHGELVRTIGGEGVTNYPIGVGINHLGQVVDADNHNNFNLTVFTQQGQLIGAYESKARSRASSVSATLGALVLQVKHAQCFDVALTDDGSVVLASKDYRLYLYRYMDSPLGGATQGDGALVDNAELMSSEMRQPIQPQYNMRALLSGAAIRSTVRSSARLAGGDSRGASSLASLSSSTSFGPASLNALPFEPAGTNTPVNAPTSAVAVTPAAAAIDGTSHLLQGFDRLIGGQ